MQKAFKFLVASIVVLLATVFVLVWFINTSPQNSPTGDVVPDLVSNVKPSVVGIIATEKLQGLEKAFFSSDQKSDGSIDVGGGTGFLVEKNGLVVTANHILDGESYTAVMSNGDEMEAEVLLQSPELDIAILDLVGDDYSVVEFNRTGIKAGERIFGIGNSLGYYNNSVLVGVVSAFPRAIEKGGYEMSDIIQLHMPISKGDSGGPVFNYSGDLIGMLIAFDERTGGMSFAVPASKIQDLINEL